VKVAIPRFRERVAPCFEYSATITIFSIESGSVVDQRDFTLQSRVALDRVRLLRDQEVDTLICGGVQEKFEDLVKARGIEVISWVSGDVEDLLKRFIKGKLKPPPERADRARNAAASEPEEPEQSCPAREEKPTDA
jgi:predicted Fe-Mo cluster-binding NifX family protein